MSSRGGLNNRFEDFGAAPESDAWQSILDTLPQEQKKKAVIFWWITGGVGIAASLFLAVTLFVQKEIEEKGFSDQKTIIDSSLKEAKKPNFQKKNMGIQAVEKMDNHLKESDLLAGINEKVIDTKQKFVKPRKQVVPKPNKSNNLIAKKPIVIEKGISFIKANGEERFLIGDYKSIELITPQEINLLEINNSEMLLSKLEVRKSKVSRWKWGGRFGSDIATVQQSLETKAITLTEGSGSGITNQAPSDTVNLAFGVNSPSGSKDVFYQKINRPISVSFLIRFSPTSRLFVEVDPTFTVLSAKHQYVLSSGQNKTHFYSINSGINIGYKIFNKRRWALDVIGGLNIEKLFGKEPLITKEKPIGLLGNSIQIGYNYHLSEKVSLRFAPKLGWIYGRSGDQLIEQFQNKTSFGVGISLLRDF